MFDDIIGNKKSKYTYKIEKNGIIVDGAILDMSDYANKGEGYITCPGLDVLDTDCFTLHASFEVAGIERTRLLMLLVTKLPDGKIKLKTRW